MARAGEKRRLANGSNGAPAVNVKIEPGMPSVPYSASSASTMPRNDHLELDSQRNEDVGALFTDAEVQALREKDAKLLRAQLADEYEAKILQLKTKHAEEKAAAEKKHAEMLATALQQNQRHVGEKAELQVEINELREKLKAIPGADAAPLKAKSEPVSAIDEQSVRREVEKQLAGEKMKMEQEFRSQIAAKDAEIEKLTGIIAELTAKVTYAESEAPSKKELQARYGVARYLPAPAPLFGGIRQMAMPHDKSDGVRLDSRPSGVSSLAGAFRAPNGPKNGRMPQLPVSIDGWSNKKRNWAIRMFRALRRQNPNVSEDGLKELFKDELKKNKRSDSDAAGTTCLMNFDYHTFSSNVQQLLLLVLLFY